MMLKKTSKPEIIKLTSNDVDGLKVRLSVGQLDENDKKIMLAILTTYQWLSNQLQTAKFSIHRLRKIFGFKTEKHRFAKNKSELSTTEKSNSLLQSSTAAETSLKKL
jgi:hypothetical protein